LKSAISIAYIQLLWRNLRLKSLSFKAINDGFGIGNNIFSLLNWELMSRVPSGVFLALILWYAFLPSPRPL
jgi:hypothetical protein